MECAADRAKDIWKLLSNALEIKKKKIKYTVIKLTQTISL